MKLLLFFLLLLIPVYGPAQDSLVYMGDIHFDSPFERNVFETISKKKNFEPFDLLIANGSLMSESQIEKSRSRLYTYLQSLNNEKFHKKSAAAKVKIITTDFRRDYLLKYVANSRFEDIFAAGYFSEVSGTALYCLAFDYLNIPYTIKTEPANTYVIAYPESNRIVVESTTTAITFFTYEPAFKQEYVQSLRRQKIISEQEFAKSSISELFDKYYLGQNQFMTIRDLAGLQYHNEGVMLLQNNNPAESFRKLEKAYFITPSPKIGYLLMQAGSRAFLGYSKKDAKHAALLGKISRYEGLGITSDAVCGEFFKVIQDLLFERGQSEQLNTYYTILTETIKSAEIKQEVDFIYYFEKGRYLYEQHRYTAALVPFEAALQLKPSSQQATTMIISCLGMMSDGRLQDEEFVKKLEQYRQRHPSLFENNTFTTLVAHTYLIHCALNFENNNPAEAERYRGLFEELLKAEVDLNPRSDLIGQAYSAGAVYYFKKGQTKRAQALLDSGLKISPGNYELTVRKNMIR
jgi:tetratricopeptide (TPR) repeat protein